MTLVSVRLFLIPLLFFQLLHFVAAKDLHQRLIDLAAANNGNIPLDEPTFDLLTSDKRTWSVAIQLTAMDQRRKCLPCREFFPAFVAVAKSWATVPKAERDNHFFATVDFDVAPTIFHKLSLVSAPVVLAYPPAKGPRRPASGKTQPVKYDFSTGFGAQALAEQLSQRTPIPIPYNPPFNWIKMLNIGLTLVSVSSIAHILSPYLNNRIFWAAMTNIPVFVFTSGFMFSHIRGVPNTGPSGEWVAAGFQNQYGQEVPVVAGLYSLMGLSFLILTYMIPKRSSPNRQRLQIYIWVFIQVVIFSTMLALFRMKHRGYPFGLLF